MLPKIINVFDALLVNAELFYFGLVVVYLRNFYHPELHLLELFTK